MTVTVNGREFDLEAVVNLMDDDIREDLHRRGFSTEQEFIDAYAAAHLEKFGAEFVVN